MFVVCSCCIAVIVIVALIIAVAAVVVPIMVVIHQSGIHFIAHVKYPEQFRSHLISKRKKGVIVNKLIFHFDFFCRL